ncbi:MAG: hypothetical protein COA43_06930 [Robiginitomaculum sp.]|nr:MAG: hypothetical protein COA43_06930 [Robiginitomaculum sp.]
MSENVIHFKSAKKKAGYAKKDAQSAENRRKFGRTKVEKTLDNFESKNAVTKLDDHKLDT